MIKIKLKINTLIWSNITCIHFKFNISYQFFSITTYDLKHKASRKNKNKTYKFVQCRLTLLNLTKRRQ